MLVTIFKNINNFIVNFFEFLSFRKNSNPVLNNDIESCVLLNGSESCGVIDYTNTFSE